ncbi:MAG TPA: tRNA (adenosine(37)-N6)-dimethylallyltransferase MiaA [Firmicutes bacterium]|nr:tRNA (adenosine(37)-N6)-dimethylallyltransferase MiaA [Bacillota bacterium]
MYIIITGATCTGKSETAVKTAEIMRGEIISADSMQVYRGMDIGTGKITPAAARGIPHHLIDILDAPEEFSAAKFKTLCERLIMDITARGKIPIVTGGTGLYIDVLIKGLADIKEADENKKKELRLVLEKKGIEYLADTLREKDPEEAAAIDTKNPRRVLRSLEIIAANNARASEIKKRASENAFKEERKMFVLEMDRQALYARIEARVDEMFKKGLIKEVESLITGGAGDDTPAMQAIGYKEIAAYMREEKNPAGAAEKVKKATKNYAKRQITWMRRYEEAYRINIDKTGTKAAAEKIASLSGK